LRPFKQISGKNRQYTNIVGKYKRSFRYSKKREPLGSFSGRFAASANEFYINRQCTYIVFILQCKKSQKQLPRYLKIAETRVVLYDINGALCEVRAYSATVSYRRSI